MAVKISSVDEAIGSNGIKALVYGAAGAGKTVLSATAKAPTLIINAESGLLSLKGAPDYIKVATVESVNDVEDVLKMLLMDNPFEWVVLDSLSEIAEVVLHHEKATSKDGRAAYGNLADQMGKIVRAFRDLKDTNVLMTAKWRRVEDENGIARYAPSMPGSNLNTNINYWFDLVMCLRVEKDDEGNTVRYLQTAQDLKFDCKDRSGILDTFEEPKLWKIAEKLDVSVTKLREEHSDVEASEAEMHADAGQPEDEEGNEQERELEDDGLDGEMDAIASGDLPSEQEAVNQ